MGDSVRFISIWPTSNCLGARILERLQGGEVRSWEPITLQADWNTAEVVPPVTAERRDLKGAALTFGYSTLRHTRTLRMVEHAEEQAAAGQRVLVVHPAGHPPPAWALERLKRAGVKVEPAKSVLSGAFGRIMED